MVKKSSASSETVIAGKLESKIVENLIELQKVHVSMIEKFDSLSKEISRLLSLFETTAKSFASNPANQLTQKDKEFLDKIDKLLEQNKTIAKGLTLMEERVRDKIYSSPVKQDAEQQMEPSMSSNRPMPRF